MTLTNSFALLMLAIHPEVQVIIIIFFIPHRVAYYTHWKIPNFFLDRIKFTRKYVEFLLKNALLTTMN